MANPPIKLNAPTPKAAPPPALASPTMAIAAPNLTLTAQKIPRVTPHLNLQALDINFAPSTGNAIPTLRVEPQYPFRASQQGIEGWVEVEFTITEQGTVNNLHVVNSSPAILFDRATVRAVSRWQFKPRIEGGKAIARHQVRQRIRYSLEASQ